MIDHDTVPMDPAESPTKPNEVAQSAPENLLPNVQAAPVAFGSQSLTLRPQLKVDVAYRFDNHVLVAGWVTGRAELGLVLAGTDLEVREVPVTRKDVATHFGLESGEGLGFVLVAETAGPDPIRLSCRAGEKTFQSDPIAFMTPPQETTLSSRDRGVLGTAVGMLALSFPAYSDAWLAIVAEAPTTSAPSPLARGVLEGGASSQVSRGAVVSGWLLNEPSALVWLETDSGRIYPIDDAFRRFRQDVHDAVGQEFGHASRESGLIMHLRGVRPGTVVQMKTISELGVHVLGETRCTHLAIDPVSAARWLFGMETPMSEMHRRVRMIDEPLLAPLLRHRQALWDELPVTVKQYGEPVAQPKATVIVPLYGRSDFIEHQLIEFSRDPWLVEHVELIYVLDDPHMVEGLTHAFESLHRLYRLPIRSVWGSVNRGFSGANNLGVREARGDYLVFLNSDAFPQRTGWVEALVDVLATRPDVGAVGPRLLFADGSIQHAGMEFMRRDELGIWVNHHPYMGLDPSLDPHQDFALVPIVTGACLAMRRADFDAVGGWDTGYLIGDFEDSDLCLKLRAAGLQVAYLPAVQLTHLERQSFKQLGHGDFRTRVAIYNAVRHQQRWSDQIAAITHGAAASA